MKRDATATAMPLYREHSEGGTRQLELSKRRVLALVFLFMMAPCVTAEDIKY